jgi:tryptophan synthase beta chain
VLPLATGIKNFSPDQQGYYGKFGGAYIPEMLHRNVEELRNCYLDIMSEAAFQQEYELLLHDYVGRPTPLFLAERLSKQYGTRIYLKREDLCHTGAHKVNNTVGQILLGTATWQKAHHS